VTQAPTRIHAQTAFPALSLAPGRPAVAFLRRLLALGAATAGMAAQAQAPAEPCFYEQPNYGGASFCTSASATWLPASQNNMISSVRVPPGWQVVLYDLFGYGAAKVTLTADTPTLAAVGFDNLTSAIKFFPPTGGAPVAAMTQRDAVRLADQATFGPTEALVTAMRSQGAARWIAAQQASRVSRYTSGSGDALHVNVQGTFFCDRAPYAGPHCWRDWFSTQPLLWDFYRNAVTQPDQLRQRVAFALQQIVVVNNLEVSGTYGFRNFYNSLLDNAFGNYRQVLKTVALSPVMGDFLNNANNDKAAPNENFARELLQLFSIGTCELNADGSLRGGGCLPTYNNEMVRNYAFALTGWTYPAGGSTIWGCWPAGTNCQYYGGNMVPASSYHDTQARPLLAGYAKAANSTAPAALETVLDSLMAHPNIGPFIGKQLIQFLVSSNPSAAYVQRVAATFASGRYTSGGQTFGTGVRGDLAATLAAVLLDSEARGNTPPATVSGRLREPVTMMTGVLRALIGNTDGDALGWWWGEVLRQHVFRPPSVFNFYPPSYPVAGTALVGPTFGIHNANTALERLNYLTYLLDWNGTAPDPNVPNARGTRVALDAFVADAADPARLVDRLSNLALGLPLAPGPRAQVINAVQWWTPATSTDWQRQRVRAAAFLVFGSPNYQVQR
jgi:uncharacterized protein (DUF1800 family)